MERVFLSTKDMQMISLEILKTISKICEDNCFRYFLAYGTLLGAVRHNGFIPWDDDVDIMMPRPDYDLFIDYFIHHSKDYPNLRLFNNDTCAQYPYMISRISDDRYRIIMNNERPYGMGIFVDIYPLDGMGDSLNEAIKFGKKGDFLSSVCYQSTRQHFAIETTTDPLKKLIKLPFFLFSKALGKEWAQSKLRSLANYKKYDHCNYVGCVVWLSGGRKDIFNKEMFNQYEMATFEDAKFRIPKKYDEILRQLYGEYMKLPPEKDRVGHHEYVAYKK